MREYILFFVVASLFLLFFYMYFKTYIDSYGKTCIETKNVTDKWGNRYTICTKFA